VILNVGERLLRQSLTLLSDCGRGRRECVLLWIGDAAEPRTVVRLEHPAHVAHRGGYRIDPSWLLELWGRLAEDTQRIIAQVHSHPREAFHSATDDRFPIVSTPGFLSVVVPDFAQGRLDVRPWFVAELQADGSWKRLANETIR
jgi:hypothetical protein